MLSQVLFTDLEILIAYSIGDIDVISSISHSIRDIDVISSIAYSIKILMLPLILLTA